MADFLRVIFKKLGVVNDDAHLVGKSQKKIHHFWKESCFLTAPRCCGSKDFIADFQRRAE
ncbi:MAG: hypothetical protein A4E74_02201 [Syntrophus sp. PtaB.Bin075]|nr:MAG: hypothetical protein A4E74_02201 [Syntrophus sp. PtaB.Bin075]